MSRSSRYQVWTKRPWPALAGQFPSGPPAPGPSPRPQDNAPLVLGDKEIRGLQSVASAASGAAPRKAPGRGLAAAAMTLALLASSSP